MRGRRTDLETAALAGALSDSGLSSYQVAKQTNLRQSVVMNILHGEYGWDKLTSDPSFKAHRLALKRKHQLANLDLQSQLLGQIEKEMPRMSAYQAAGSYGILFDKERLMAGEATENVSVISRQESEGLAALVDLLKAEIASRKDSQPTDSTDSKVV